MQETTNPIELAQNGSPEAFGLLYRLHHPAIFRYLFFRTGDRQTAEDLTGEVFLKMVQAINGFSGGQPAFRAWLFQIARNLSIDHLRKIQAHPNQTLGEELPAPGLDPEHSTEMNLNEAGLRAALIRLSNDQKDVILMRFIEGLPLAETARTLHKSEDAIKGLQRRALAALREALTPLES
jgi:RNA polymerase sigma-70 factor, ECF subfamily